MATAEFASTTSCPLAPLVDEAIRLIKMREMFELRSEDLFDAAATRLLQLEDAVLNLQPRSRRGGLLLLLVTLGQLDPYSNTEDPAGLQALIAAQRGLEAAALALAEPGDDALLTYYVREPAHCMAALAA